MKRCSLIRTMAACASRRKRIYQAIHSVKKVEQVVQKVSISCEQVSK